MARKKMSKKEFDAQFDAFLRDSVSSEESISSSRINKYLEPKKKKKDDVPWWMQDDDDDTIGTGTGKSFLKKKQPEPEHSTPIRDDRPTPLKSSLGGDKPSPIEANDKQKSKTKKEKQYFKTKTRGPRGKADASMSKDSLEDISEKSEEESQKDRKIHLKNDSSYGSRNGTGKPGFDTLDEIAEKERFFKDMEREGTVDYGRLNQDLSGTTGNTLSPEGPARGAATLAALEDIEEDEVVNRPQTYREMSERTEGTSHQKPSMLSKVSLMDSMESTMNTTGTSPKVGQNTLEEAKEGFDDVDGQVAARHSQPTSMKTGTEQSGSSKQISGFMGTNTSMEMEAVYHQALQETGQTNESQPFDSYQGNKSNNSQLVHKILSEQPRTKSGKERTVEEVLQEMEELDRESKKRKDIAVELLEDRRKQPYSPNGPAKEMEEIRGYDLSPVHQDSPRGGFDNSHTEDTEMYQPVTQVTGRSSKRSVSERGRSKRKETKERKKGKDDSKERTKKGSPQRRKKSPSISPRRSMSASMSPRRWAPSGAITDRSHSPVKPSGTLNPKFAHVKSSGYGTSYSPSKNMTMKERQSSSKERLEDNDRQKRRYDRKLDVTDRHDERTGILDRKAVTDVWSPVDVAKQKIKGTESPTNKKQKYIDPGMESQLNASVDAFANYIKEHFTDRNIPEAKYSIDEPSIAASWKGDKSVGLDDDVGRLKASLEEERRLHRKTKDDLVQVEKEYGSMIEMQKQEFEEQIFKLKQEIFVLQAKVPEDETEIRKKMVEGLTDGASKGQVERFEKELKEQETLLEGYQQENKKLYQQLKTSQKQSKQAEERMFKENQKMATEVSNLRTLLERQEVAYKNKGVITSLPVQQNIAAGNTEGGAVLGAGKIAILEAEFKEAKRQEENAKRELSVLQKTKVELEQHIDQIIKEKEQLRKKLEESKGLKSEEAKEIEEKYIKENEKISRKLKWYAENQQILDKDAKILKEKEEEIAKLKVRIEELKSETGKKKEENKTRAKERANDAKKIQDLQRQVKEMEQIIRRRHPNSLPALIMTAAIASEEKPGSLERTPTVIVLENQLKKLEAELETKDEESERMLRSVEQKYHTVKLQYEDRIKDLEAQLHLYKRPDDNSLKEYDHPHTSTLAVQRELDSVRERYKKQVAELQTELNNLNNELNKTKTSQEVSLKNELKMSKDQEADLKNQVKVFRAEIESKNHDLQILQKSIERLRKEKHLYLVNGFTNDTDKNKKMKGKGKMRKKDEDETEVLSEMNGFTDRVNEKQYEPETFADRTHISDVIKENEVLKSKVDELQLEVDTHRIELQKYQAHFEDKNRKTREKYEEQIGVLRSSHQRELQKFLADNALQHSASKMAELQSKTDAQQVMIKHLKDQLNKSHLDSEQLSILRIQNASLENQIDRLKEELREAKKFHTPEMKHFESIQQKIIQMEKKRETRELELQQIIKNAKHTASVEMDQEANKWKGIVDSKNSEIQRFRTELDSILDVLKLLQKQGVVIPVSAAVS
ncbi:centrosomal protein of 162 kDa-like [Mytilus edulis]|uniref:centrosomal protein of 162 kDa-like n=1 Tax=Mytilus edulis TaxID=6550 RepID=UPI0039EFD0C5